MPAPTIGAGTPGVCIPANDGSVATMAATPIAAVMRMTLVNDNSIGLISPKAPPNRRATQEAEVVSATGDRSTPNDAFRPARPRLILAALAHRPIATRERDQRGNA